MSTTQVCFLMNSVMPRSTNFIEEYAFVFVAVMLGCISVGGGFVRDKIVLIVLRALSGIGMSPRARK